MNRKKKHLLMLLMLIGLFGFLLDSSRSSLVRFVLSINPTSQTADQKATLASLEQINDHPFYRMTYYGEYSQFLELKRKYYWAFGLPKPHCTTFASLNLAGDSLLGYNSDGEQRPLLLLHTSPSDGYASISIIDIGEDLGFDAKHTPFESERARSLLLYAPYFANTGMNEMGLAFGVMADPDGRSSMDPNKEMTFPSEIRRYVLDDARDVDEAIAILSQYNVSYDDMASRILLADRSGHSAVVEWVEGAMRVTRNQEPWQVAANVRLYGAQLQINQYAAQYQSTGAISKDVNGRSYWRYVTAWETLKRADGLLSMEQGMNLLSAVSLTVTKEVWWPTQYSVVYNLTTGQIQIATDRDYARVYDLQLKMKHTNEP